MKGEIRIGKISSIDYPAGMVRVVYHEKDDEVTKPIALQSFEYMMPEVGDQVLMTHLSTGTEAAYVIGRPWSNVNRPPEGFRGLYRKDLDREAGKAMIRYDANTGKLLIVMPDTELDCPTVLVIGDVTIRGNLHVTGEIVCDKTITAAEDVVGGGVSLKNHTHTCPDGATSKPE